MNDGSLIHRDILDNLLDGVVVVGLDGVIATINPAAAHMFGLAPEAAVGKTFSEVFIAIEGFDEFTQAVLDAITDRDASGRRMVGVRLGEEDRSLTVTTSYLNSSDGSDATGVIVLLSDITEVRELREASFQMAKELEAQHAELQKAYREVEKSNDQLTSVLKRVQVARVVATVVVIGLFVGVGVWNWGRSSHFRWVTASGPAPAVADGGSEALRTVKVTPREFNSTTALIGRLAPWRQVQVTSPVDSHVKAVLFEYGGAVTEGQRLVELDVSDLRLEYQEAQVEYQKAENALAAIEDWENGSEVSNALRSYAKARMARDSQQTKLKTSAFLLEQGLIPAREHADLKLQFENQLLDFEAVEQDLAAARARGGGEARRVARLERDKARSRLRALEQSVRLDAATAPITGVIQAPASFGRGLAAGQEVKKGDALLTIADFRRLSVVTQIDEVDVTKIRPGQPVTVRGDAFPGLEITGAVSHVSSQGVGGSGRGPSRFTITAVLDALDAAGQEQVRAGMSAQIRIVTYRNPSALLVPIAAVDTRDGRPRVRVLDTNTGTVQDRAISTGLTTLRSVEVTRGLNGGEEVVLPEG